MAGLLISSLRGSASEMRTFLMVPQVKARKNKGEGGTCAGRSTAFGLASEMIMG